MISYMKKFTAGVAVWNDAGDACTSDGSLNVSIHEKVRYRLAKETPCSKRVTYLSYCF